ncbi:MAG: GxxExxY protein [Ignavibacteriaceae bacterium]
MSKVILDSSIEVHRNLGPGLLEGVYEKCLCKEFDLRGIKYFKQVKLPIKYKQFDINAHLVIDLLVENEIIIELKAVDALHPVHEAQLITYLKLADKRLGFLINFNVPKLVDGFKRKVNNF